MENLLLSKLDFEINSTTTSSFKDRFLKASGGDCRETYFTEVRIIFNLAKDNLLSSIKRISSIIKTFVFKFFFISF